MKSVELKKYVREEIVMAFKLTEETYNELVDTFPIAGMDLAFGYQDGEPYLELPICGGGKEEAHIGDYIAPFGSCFRVYKQSAFEGYFVLKGEQGHSFTGDKDEASWYECSFESRIAGFDSLTISVQGFNEADAAGKARALLGHYWTFISCGERVSTGREESK